MSRRPTLKLVETNGTGKEPADAPSPPSARDPRALNRLDWVGVGLIVAALLIAPLWAANFATPRDQSFLFAGVQDLLNLLGFPCLLGLMAAALFVVFWRESQRPVAIGAVAGLPGALTLLGGWAILSLAHSQVLYASLDGLAALFAALLLGGLVARLARDPKALAILLMTIVIAGSIVAAIGVQEYLIQWKQAHNPQYRTFSTFVNPDFLAGYLLMTVPITLSVFTAAVERAVKLSLGVGLVLQSACLLLTGSRAGFAVLAVSVVAWLALTVYSGAARNRSRQIASTLGLSILGALLGSMPLLWRVAGIGAAGTGGHASALSAITATADAQSHSAAFRRYTWMGTVEMAKANPLLGTGIGTFPVAYPRYGETAFTAHAHNSFLQWTAETGLPGVMLLLTAMAAATAFASHVLVLQRVAALKAAGASSTRLHKPLDASVREQSLLLAGLLSAILASLLHSLFDSDWYIVATLFTLSAIVALLAALARDIAPLATQRPRPLGREMIVIGSLIGLFLIWRAGATGLSRFYLTQGMWELQDRQPEAALAAFDHATVDLLDPEPHLRLAEVYDGLGRTEEGLRELQLAVKVAPIGATWYRLAKHYVRDHEWDLAVDAFEKARRAEPRNVQNLRALADTLATQAGITLSGATAASAAGSPPYAGRKGLPDTGAIGVHPHGADAGGLTSSGVAPVLSGDQSAQRIEQAISVYRDLTALEQTPYGRVRAVPEVVETEFAYGHAGLADIAFAQGRWADAVREYALANNVLDAYWQSRHSVMNLRSPEKQAALASLRENVLNRWKTALQNSGAGRTEEAARVNSALHRFYQDQEEDKKSMQTAEPGESTNP